MCCTFDSPIARCELMHVMVLTDETQHECACENGCPSGIACPLARFFSGEEMVAGRCGPLHAVPVPAVVREVPSRSFALAAAA
jgi:hypothetical protein